MENSTITEDGQIEVKEVIDSNFKIPRKTETADDEIEQTSVVDDNADDAVEFKSQEQRHGYSPNPLKRLHEERNNKEPDASGRNSSFIEIYDPTLPKELTLLFKPLHCELCNIQHNSTVTAKLHYSSRNHTKKVRKFLIDYSERTGEPLHKKALITNASNQESSEPRFTYCETCDLKLTSKIHAEQHYMGKNHQKAIMGKRAPAGAGRYNEEGKWQRSVKQEADPTGRFGIGLAFVTEEEKAAAAAKGKAKPPQFDCDLCQVSVGSLEQLNDHLQGQRHKKNLKKSGVAAVPKVQPAAQLSINYSAFRTPSGEYYCQVCNLSLNSEVQFGQHMFSRRHIRNKTASKQ